ncbi:hypothetical protein HME9304_01347 [Flagellimonas maritima]|uniref:IPExxxVDY family protein n=1 Tax=Flagellimonas maritima TaxID=1383885 RepID=A0A2Z4LSU6_9FLAO|nr:IPExxxVDY family protein [Allomuricauda aurantiaca]AWX44347.1 hypothetical protein HME9304_01347 [Allomuricauda aurantiaca]
MSTTHRISADFYDDNFQLIAIHSGLEDFALAYAINFNCCLHLKRVEKDLQFAQDLSFSVFDWEDKINDRYWTLISNNCAVEVAVSSIGLFGNDTSFRKNYLIKEKKEVDYFLKIDGEKKSLVEDVKSINKIPKVVTAYPMAAQDLKSKRNLIF